MDPSPSGRDGQFSEVSSSLSKARQPRTMPNSRATSTDASTIAPVSVGLTRENTNSSTEQGSMNSSITKLPSIASATAEGTGSDLSAPVQKRRRITRACDECRRKKIKCDGKQPCLHCTVYSYECTYDQPSNRSRKPHPQYVESLEQRLQQAESMLKSLVPGIELEDQDLTSWQQRPAATNVEDRQDSSALPSQSFAMAASDLPVTSANVPAQGSDVKPSLGGTAQLEIDQHGLWHYYGQSSGLSLVKQINKAFDNVSFEKDKVDSTPPAVEPPPVLHSLSREVIYRLCKIALQDACTLCPIVHEPTFKRNLKRTLGLPRADYQLHDHRFLTLLYAVLAVGCIFAKDESLLASEEGYKYFKASQHSLNLTDCQNILSLQSLLYIVIYLQLSANVTKCYFYIGVAVRSAYQLGLHRSFSNVVDNREISSHISAIEIETRKRVFWAIFKIDVVTSSFLGLPICSHSTEIDQESLAEVDDEHITENGIEKEHGGDASRPSAANAHSNLVQILRKINEWIYPIYGTVIKVASSAINDDGATIRSETDRMRKYMARNQKIKELERDLQNWSDTLPFGLRPNGDAPPRVLRNQQLLRFLFAQTQMTLYRPLLHEHLVICDYSDKSKISIFKEELSKYAGNCVSVSRNIIHITSEVHSQYLLQKDYWFAIYTTFFAFLITATSLLEGSANRADNGLLDDMKMGKDALSGLSKQNTVANCCDAILDSEFKSLSYNFSRDRSKEPKEYTGRTLTLSHNMPSIQKTSQLPNDATMSTLSGFDSGLSPNIGSPTMEHPSQRSHQQECQKQQHDEKHILEDKQQQYRNFIANIYPGRPATFNPSSSSSSHHQDTPAVNSELAEQVSSSHDATYHPEISNSDVDALPSLKPSTILPLNPNPQLPIANISDLLFTPADPFAYPFSPFSCTPADVTSGALTGQVRDVEMADYFKFNPLAAFHDNMYNAEEPRNYGLENNPPGMEYDWGQGDILNPVLATVSVSAPKSTKTLAYAHDVGTGSVRNIDGEQSQQHQKAPQQQQQQQQQPQLQQHGPRHDYGQEVERILDHGQLGHTMETAQTETASGFSPSSEDESNDDEADDAADADADADDNETEGDDDNDDDEDEDSDD